MVLLFLTQLKGRGWLDQVEQLLPADSLKLLHPFLSRIATPPLSRKNTSMFQDAVHSLVVQPDDGIAAHEHGVMGRRGTSAREELNLSVDCTL
jgi:hypothetical protein